MPMKPLFTINSSFHGRGKVHFAWQPAGNFIATAGGNGLIHVFDRHGQQIEEIGLDHPGQCLGLDWDKDGELLAILQEGNPRVPVWELATRKVMKIDTTLKDPTFLKWSRTGPQLAIGTAQGNLLIYRKDNRKKIPFRGKHTKKIVCGAWSSDGRLALGGEDNMLTMSSQTGETIEHTELKHVAHDIQFATQKTDGRRDAGGDTTLSVNMGGRTILLYSLDDPENPIELAFQPRYGSIVQYKWFGDGYMMLGFSEGYLVVISTHMAEIGEELFSGRLHKDRLDDIACSSSMMRAATAGNNSIKMLDMSDKQWKELKDESATVDEAHGPIDRIGWTVDGQILTAATRSGTIYNFVARMPTINAAHGTRVAHMSSLRELTIVDTLNSGVLINLAVSIEPAIVGLGLGHVAVGMNNRVWFYRCEAHSRELVNEKEYLSTVTQVLLGRNHAAVMCDGRVSVHAIEEGGGGGGGGPGGGGGGSELAVLPNRDDAPRVTCMQMTDEFVMYGTDEGTIEYFFIDEWCMLPGSELRHTDKIVNMWSNPTGTRIVFLDALHRCFVYNPVNSMVLPVMEIQEGIKKVLWDTSDWGVFVTSDDVTLQTYVHVPLSISGPTVTRLGNLTIHPNGDIVMDPGETEIPFSYSPITVFNGVVTCQIPNGSLQTVTLTSHASLNRGGRVTTESLSEKFKQNLALHRLGAAWEVAFQIGNSSFLSALAGKSMETLEIAMAIRVYRQLGDVGMVMALEAIEDVDDKNLLAGHISMLFGDYNSAQELFLTSSRPVTALEMRRDLLHWDHALKLAESLAPEEVSELSMEYGKTLEFKGEYENALRQYQTSMSRMDPSKEDEHSTTVRTSCQHGIARMTLRNGDIRRGVNMAKEIDDDQLSKDCAGILESMKQYNDAASLFVQAKQYDKAVNLYLFKFPKKNFAAAEPLMDRITQPRLHSAFAKAKEAAKDYNAAVKAYERARDMDSVVRILLNHLNKPEQASAIVRKSKSPEGAKMVSKYCSTMGDFRGAIEFLLMAKSPDDAFALAQSHNEMGVYAEAIGDTATDEDYLRIAQYYESKSEWGQAGMFYKKCDNYHKALKLFLQCGDRYLSTAIEVVGMAKNDVLTHTLIDFLMGETDGVPKDPHYIFRLYMALKNYRQAINTALFIAKQERDLGNYKLAHDVLFETHKYLQEPNIRVPQSLNAELQLLHSYTLVKKLVKQGNHSAAARMLVRVAKSISKFKVHMVAILTSTVIECQRAGMKRSAFEYASMLVRAEHRSLIEPKYKRKIEALVRRPNKEEVDEGVSPCPKCSAPVPDTTLDCSSCKTNIPYCIVTGRHMVLDDWSFCPQCKWPALYSGLTAYVSTDTSCPMCSQTISASAITLSSDPVTHLNKLLHEGDEDEESKDGESKEADGPSGGGGGGAR